MEPIIRPHGRRHTRARKTAEAQKYSFAQLQEMWSLDFEAKIQWAQERIELALDRLENPSIAFSGGKDSTVLLHLILPYRPEIVVILGNTTIEFPESLGFARRLARDWNLNYHEAKPEVTFWWVVENYGWPLLGKTFGVGGVAHKESRRQFFETLEEQGKLTGDYAIQAQVPISSACCTFLKERPSQQLQKEMGIDGVFLGIMASESRQRLFNFLRYGEWYFPKSQGVWKCHPLAIWTDQDIWQYIRTFDVPYSPLYDMGFRDQESGEYITHKRNGCMFCGMDLKFKHNHLSIMRRTHPKAWDVLMRKRGLGRVLWKLRWALDDGQLDMFERTMSLDDYLDTFPCVFDRV